MSLGHLSGGALQRFLQRPLLAARVPQLACQTVRLYYAAQVTA